MPSDDVILALKQIAGYPPSSAIGGDTVVVQRGGLGGPYVSYSVASLVSNALATGGDMAVSGGLSAASIQTGSLQASNAAVNLLTSQKASIVQLDASFAAVGGDPVATQAYVAALRANSVTSVNGRVGDIALTVWDVCGAAPIHSPRFNGQPRAPTPPPWSCSSNLATTAFVHGSIASYLQNFAQEGVVTTFNGRGGAVVLTAADVIAADAGFAPLDSPAFLGFPSAPTAPPGTQSGQLATTAFVMNAVEASTSGVASFNGRTGIVTLSPDDLTGAGGALLASPVFTGQPQAPTAIPGTATLQIASTAFVGAAIAAAPYAPLSSPAFVGIPTGPTAANTTNNNQLATTGFVQNVLQAIDAGVTTFNGRSGAVSLIGNDVSAAGGALLASPVFSGSPQAPTAAPGTSTGQLATTQFVMSALGAVAFVQSFNGRGGAVTLSAADVSAAGALMRSGGTMTGELLLAGNAVAALDALPLQQLRAAINAPAALSVGMGSSTTILAGAWRTVVYDGPINADPQGGMHQPFANFYQPKIPGLYYFQVQGSGGSSIGNTNGFGIQKNATTGAGPGISGTSIAYIACSQLSGVVLSCITYMNGVTDNISVWVAAGTGNTSPGAIQPVNPALIGYLLLPTI